MLLMDCKNKEPLLLISLARITFLSLAEKINLLKNLDSSNNLALLSIEDISKYINRSIKVTSWNGKENLLHAQKELSILEKKNIGWLAYWEEDYPALLREIPNAPFLLFYRGNSKVLTAEKSVSVVGTRRISPESKIAAQKFAYDAVNDNCTVVSGLAYGVDSAAHRGCIKAYFDAIESSVNVPNGKTVAVLPCGCDTIVPTTNANLAQKILSCGGCIVSEYVPGTPAQAWRFVQRNRIVAALSPATVVIQAPVGSGALLTAGFALEYNRDVVFHSSGFCENSQKIASSVYEDLKKKVLQNQACNSKLQSSSEMYLEAGASVVEDYADFQRYILEPPGMRKVKTEQMTLF